MMKLVPFVAAIVASVSLAACGSTHTTPSAPHKGPSQAIPSPTPCKPLELLAKNGECIPANRIKSPGTKGSEARPDSSVNAVQPKSLNLRRAPTAGKHIDHPGMVLIERFEGFEGCPYWDAYGGVWTRGYGETEGIRRNSPCISRSFGERNLKVRVERYYEWAIRGIGVYFNQNQWDALCSFAWNLGAGIFTGSLRSSLRNHNPYPLLGYVHAGGQVLAGLVTRRRAEVQFFLRPVHGPKPLTPAQKRALKRKKLYALYRQRNGLQYQIRIHRCRTIHGRHAYRACPNLGHKWRVANHRINILHRERIF